MRNELQGKVLENLTASGAVCHCRTGPAGKSWTWSSWDYIIGFRDGNKNLLIQFKFLTEV